MSSTFGLIIGFKNDIRPIIKFHFRQCFQNMNLFFDTQFAKNTSSLNIRCDDKTSVGHSQASFNFTPKIKKWTGPRGGSWYDVYRAKAHIPLLVLGVWIKRARLILFYFNYQLFEAFLYTFCLSITFFLLSFWSIKTLPQLGRFDLLCFFPVLFLKLHKGKHFIVAHDVMPLVGYLVV